MPDHLEILHYFQLCLSAFFVGFAYFVGINEENYGSAAVYLKVSIAIIVIITLKPHFWPTHNVQNAVLSLFLSSVLSPRRRMAAWVLWLAGVGGSRSRASAKMTRWDNTFVAVAQHRNTGSGFPRRSHCQELEAVLGCAHSLRYVLTPPLHYTLKTKPYPTSR